MPTYEVFVPAFLVAKILIYFPALLKMQDYKFRLHENPEFAWSPRLSAKDFMAILSNITAVRIRGTYVRQGMGFIDEVRLGTAERNGGGNQATWIER
jgi:coxsackievirus/adenovirus receptor